MPLLIERRTENSDAEDTCPICNKPKRMHTFKEIQICSKKFDKMNK